RSSGSTSSGPRPRRLIVPSLVALRGFFDILAEAGERHAKQDDLGVLPEQPLRIGLRAEPRRQAQARAVRLAEPRRLDLAGAEHDADAELVLAARVEARDLAERTDRVPAGDEPEVGAMVERTHLEVKGSFLIPDARPEHRAAAEGLVSPG